MKQPYVLAVGSFAVHGTASLKTFITFLGEKILPVPSLLLNGLTNMEMVRKFNPPFEELLSGTFELAAARGLELIVYIGYLGEPGQADVISKIIRAYSYRIKAIIADPVCGDHGRAYVPAEVIAKWPELIRLADMAFPNITEIKILTGHKPDAIGETETFVNEFRQLFPQTKLVLTSHKPDESSIGFNFYGGQAFSYSKELLPKNYGGTGDAFLALFILKHFYLNQGINEALKSAADDTYFIIKNSIENDSDDLILSANKLSK
jgi:pyridoxine kinase